MDPVSQLNVWTNVPIAAIIYLTLVDFKRYMILNFYFINVFLWSTLLHSCDTFLGGRICPLDFAASRAIDHMVAQYGFLLLGIFFIPYITDFQRTCLTLGTFTFHAMIHAFRSELLIDMLLAIECIFTLLMLFCVLRYVRWSMFVCAMVFGLAGIVCYFLDDVTLYGYTHAAWHVCIFIAFFFMIQCAQCIPQYKYGKVLRPCKCTQNNQACPAVRFSVEKL